MSIKFRKAYLRLANLYSRMDYMNQEPSQAQPKRFSVLEEQQTLEMKSAEFFPSNYEEHNVVEDVFYLSQETKDLKVAELAKQYNIDQKKLMWKTDLCVLPPFALLYLISFLNKSTFGMVYVNGLTASLEITPFQLICAFAAFFVPIILFQGAANISLRIVRPHFIVSSTVLLYGCFNLGLGFSKNYATVVILQFFHGLFQAGTETTIIYMLSHYYSRKEAPIRFSGLYAFNCLAGALINFMSWGIQVHMEGSSGLEAWRWILIIIGALTIFSSFVLFFSVPDFPESARFFDDAETYFMVNKLEIYSGVSGYSIKPTPREYFQVFKDPLIIIPPLAAIYIGYVSTAYCSFEPEIFRLNVASVAAANKNSAWAYLLGFGYMIIFTAITDKWISHFTAFAFNTMVAFTGGLLFVCDKSPFSTNYKLAGNYLIVIGTFTSMPILACWTTTNVCGHLRKSIITSLEISFHDLGGLISLFSFIKLGVGNRNGLLIGVVLSSVAVCLGALYSVLLYHANKIKRSSEYKETFAMHSERRKILLGDKNPSFDYML